MLSRPSLLVLLAVSVFSYSTGVAGRKEPEPVYTCEWSDDDERWKGCTGKEEAYINEAFEWDTARLHMEHQQLQIEGFSAGDKVVRGRLVPAGPRVDKNTKDWIGKRNNILTQILENGLLKRKSAATVQDPSEGEL